MSTPNTTESIRVPILSLTEHGLNSTFLNIKNGHALQGRAGVCKVFGRSRTCACNTGKTEVGKHLPIQIKNLQKT